MQEKDRVWNQNKTYPRITQNKNLQNAS